VLGMKFKIGVMVALFTALLSLGWLYRVEIQKGARQAATILQQQAELADRDRRIEDLSRQRAAAEAVAAREKARAAAIREEMSELRYAVQKLEQDNQAVRDWGDTPMPRELYDLLRTDADNRPD
jgi:uncharacterized membrane protein YdfJ with MMPL/SSD domain